MTRKTTLMRKKSSRNGRRTRTSLESSGMRWSRPFGAASLGAYMTLRHSSYRLTQTRRLARYNPNAHFVFRSQAAEASVPALTDALVRGKLRNRPVDATSEARAQLLLHFARGK
jgi:hypothetical protein